MSVPVVPINLTVEEAKALLSWYQRRYHEMVQNSDVARRFIAELQAEVASLRTELARATKGGKP